MSRNSLLIILGVVILILVMTILGIPYIHWGFVNDDFGNISHCFIKNYKNIIKYFYEGNMECLTFDSKTPWTQNFICGLYRPMSFIYYLPQAYLFKTYAYGYFLTTIMLHAINSTLIFYMLSQFANIFIAFLLASYFAFHPSLIWLGWISAQTYYWELLVLILISITLKCYLDSKKIFFYVMSCCLYLLNIYLKEATIILPIWIIAAVYTYQCEFNKSNESFFKKLKQSLIVSSGFWLVSTFYLITRALVFPIDTITSQTHTQFNFTLNLSSFLVRQKSRIFDFVTYISDLCGLRNLPENHQIIKSLLIFLIFSTVLFLFFKNSKKRILLFLMFSILIFSWPALLMQYQPRYTYMSLAFLIMLIGVLITYTNIIINCKTKAISTLLSMILISTNGLFLIKTQKHTELKLHANNAVLKELVEDHQFNNAINQNYAICFFNIHPNFATGLAPAMWLFTQKNDFPVYCYAQKPDMNELKKHTDKQILFIAWDYENSKFKILNNL